MAEGANINAFDPVAADNAKKVLSSSVNFCADKYDCLNDADALAILTEWSEFRTPDFDLMIQKMKEKNIFDGRNLYKTETMKELGFYYNSMGRK